MTSRTNWERVDALKDDEIDTSDIAPLDDVFFEEAEIRMPQEPASARRRTARSHVRRSSALPGWTKNQ
jgi:hypothetical protein